jgi:hypothetical protein
MQWSKELILYPSSVYRLSTKNVIALVIGVHWTIQLMCLPGNVILHIPGNVNRILLL